MTIEKLLSLKNTGNLKETGQIIWTTFAMRDYAVLPGSFKNPHIVDIGSHIGVSALYFKWRHPQATIECFEPDSRVFSMLEENTKGLDGVTLINAAVHDFSGQTQLGINEVAWGNSLTDKNISVKQPVRVISASEICQNHVDLLKIDAEGSEHAILRDLAATGAINNVDNIVLEYHGLINGKHHLNQLLEIFRNNGFTYTIGHDVRVLPADETEVLTTKQKKFEYLVLTAKRQTAA